MMTRGAITNLVNRYRAVLSRCRLANLFGSLAVGALLTLGSVTPAGAVSIYHPNGGEYNYPGENLSYTNPSGDSVQASIYTNSSHDKVTITIGDENTQRIESTALGGIAAAKNGHIILNAQDVVITSTDTSGVYSALWAQNNSTGTSTPLEERASIIINAQNTTLTSGSSAIVAMSNGMVEINGNLRAQAPDVLLARGDAIININKAGTGTVQLEGDMDFNYDGKTSGTGVDAQISINLTDADSWWKGNTLISWTPKKDGSAPGDLYVSQMTLNLANGATWIPTAITSSDDPSVDASGSTYTSLNNLNLNNGVINLNTDVNVQVDNMNGTGTVNMAVNPDNPETAGTLTAQKAEGAALNVNLTGVTSDDLTAKQAASLVQGVSSTDEQLTVTGNVDEGLVNGALTINADGSTKMSRNRVMEAALETASVSSIALDRILTNDLRKRMGDLRSANGEHGLWVRWDGGKLKGDSGLTNNFNTIQIGADTAAGQNVRLGLAASFTHGDIDHSRGTSDMEGVALAGYGVWMAENGLYADVVGRIGTFRTDMGVDGHEGTLDSLVASLSGEMGWRFDLSKLFYVEPQVELAYTYIDGDSFTLGSASYDIDDTDSLIGRAGLVAGINLPDDRGNIYARASVVQQFLGDAKISGQNNGLFNTLELDGDETWVEYGIGANVRLTDAVYAWVDVERTEGATIDEEWRGTVGLRYSF